MADKAMDNNQVTIVGTVDSEFTYSHEVFGEGFYMLEVVVNRLSHMEDRIPLMVSERLVDVKESYRGKIVEVHGQFRSYNKHEESRNRLILSVFVREFAFVGEEGTLTKPNSIYLDGYICKPPIKRTSPLGREICDIMLAVNRMYNKSDYIPCIAWGRNASYAAAMEVGEKICIEGRIQSRQYNKKDSEGNVTVHTAYEVSVIKIDEAEQADKDEII